MADRLRDALGTVGEQAESGMTERDVATAVAAAGVYEALGYEGPGVDVHAERRLSDDRRADAVLTDGAGGVVAVVEFKAPERSVTAHRSQLAGYVESLEADAGVVTNGRELAVYRRETGETVHERTIQTTEPTDEDVRVVKRRLQHRHHDLRDRNDVAALLAERQSVSLANPDGRAFFFETFRLSETSSFGKLVSGLVDLLAETDSTAVQRDFEYWSATYASVPDEPPDSWVSVVGDASLEKFAFCLETAHALLSRLLLAKATGDYGLFEDDRDDWLRHALASTRTTDGEVQVGEYARVAREYVTEMRESLVTAAFQADLFGWWHEATSETQSVRTTPADRFGRALGRLAVEVLQFDFQTVDGDLLGELYQEYFDPETRKALGEFYTPEPLVETMLDEVGYDGAVTRRRLLDPACGSGTFLVAAVERYLAAVERGTSGEPDWPTHLQRLCTTPRVVGLDVHPFAVLMAQIRFVAAILPQYREAKRQQPGFTLRRLPIYRTDALRVEPDRAGGGPGAQTGLRTFETGDRDIFVPVPLPIEADGGSSAVSVPDELTVTRAGFLLGTVRMPRYRTTTSRTSLASFEEYFGAMQGLLDTVRFHVRAYAPDDGWDWTYRSGLAERIERYTGSVDAETLAFFRNYVDHVLASIERIPDRREDPGLVGLFEDTLLAVIVKSHLSYDYVVANPPYVRSQTLSAERKTALEATYKTTTGAYDLYCPFYERAVEWLTEAGRLAFVSPNGFFRTGYGRGLRECLATTRIERIYDFRDSGVFDDATNYPAVVVASAESDPQARADNDVRCVRVKSTPQPAVGRDADAAGHRSERAENERTENENERTTRAETEDEQVLAAIRAHSDEPGYDGRLIDVFDVPQAGLDEQPWLLSPPEERRVIRRLRSAGDAQLGAVTDAVFQGLRTGANGVFVVRVTDAGRIGAGETGRTVRIEPTGDGAAARIETDTLRPFLAGRDVSRWRGTWDGLHLLFPYCENDDGSLRPYTREELAEQVPATLAYLERHEPTLRSRDRRANASWWAFARRQNLRQIGQPKTIGAEIADRATFALDADGEWAFTTAYGIAFDETAHTDLLTAQLNAAPLDFLLKHLAPIKQNGYYSYRAAFLERLPVRTNECGPLRETIEQLLDAHDTQARIERFPGPYLDDHDGRLAHVTHEWQTTRRPVTATVQTDADDRVVVAAGRTDRIRTPAMTGDTVEATRQRATYVARAVDGRRVRAGETTRVAIPVATENVTQLLAARRADERRLAETDTDALNARVDQLVADAFGLTEADRAVVSRFLDAF